MWLEGEEVNIYFVSTFCNYTNNCQTLKVKVSKPLEQNGALNRRGCLVVVGEISQLLVQKQFSNILLIAKIIQVMFTNNLCMVFLITSIFHFTSLYCFIFQVVQRCNINRHCIGDTQFQTLFSWRTLFHMGGVSELFDTLNMGEQVLKVLYIFWVLWHSKCGWALTKRIQNMKTSFRH